MSAAMDRTVITARGLRKAYKNKVALAGTDFEIRAGRIVGLIGPNGAGKTTALKAILGLTPFEGQLRVLGKDPRSQRDELMNEVCFIADVPCCRAGSASARRSSSSPACTRASMPPSAAASCRAPS